jgi:GT2 family glycosyltransferase/glycosyltransferase involved in cell wall biosynthesis
MNPEQGQALSDEPALRDELERRLADAERHLDAFKDLLRVSEERRRDERQTFEELRHQRALLEAEIANERELLRAQLAEERELFRADMTDERERLRSEAEARERAHAIQEEEQFLRFKAAVDVAMQREDALARVQLDAAQRLTQVDGLLSTLENRLTSNKGLRALATAQREIATIIEDLRRGTPRPSLGKAPGSTRAPLPYDPNRILPGRPPSDIFGVTAPNGTALLPSDAPAVSVDIVVCVHNALEDVMRCLASLERHTDARHGVIVVDDGSDDACAIALQEFTARHPNWTLIRNEEPAGYTRAANQGLRQSEAELVVLLNSDTIVTPHWVERLLECAQSDPAIGIVGPLSNAASYQSVPAIVGPDGDWSINPLPPEWEIDQVGAAVALVSRRSFPRVPFVNGFCLAIKRDVIDAIGYFDEAAFPTGYGEENDYCLRAADAGFALAIADHAYVHHAKSRSYSHERRRDLGKEGRQALLQKYDVARVKAAEARLRADPDLARMRQALAARLTEPPPVVDAPSVLFLLPVSGGGGGAHSIVQEAAGMRRLGARARVAVQARHLQLYRRSYPALEDADDVFIGYDSLYELGAYAADFSVVVATIHTSVPDLAMIAAAHPTTLPAYYVQDYEPYFFPAGSPERDEAAASYTLLPNALHFAKTQWLCDLISELHGVEVHKVSPSLDHTVYYPPPAERQNERVRIAAMIRPRSARRGAPRTMAVLRQLVAEFGKAVDVHIFGCVKADIEAAGLPTDFRYKNHGILKREQVADQLRKADIFLDLSDYQAFGRTGLEAMACGCAVVVPALGGTSEYAVHGENALIVDTSSLDACFAAARELVDDVSLRARLERAGLAKASEYSIECAARSEVELFRSMRPNRQRSAVTISTLEREDAYV